LLGPNGAGKSTTMKVLTCYLVADGGTASIAGMSIDNDPVEVRKHIGYLPENAPLYTEMRVEEYLHFVGRVRGLSAAKRKERIDWAVTECGLQPKFKSPIGTLSRGFRQRVGLAQAVLHDPDLLILDEPTSGLDPIQLIEIRDLIRDIGEKQQKTVFFSTHIMQEVEAVCNRAILINRGRLIVDGAPGELKRKSAQHNHLVARVRGAEPEEVRAALAKVPAFRQVEVTTMPERGVLELDLHVAGDGGANAAGERFFAVAREKGWPVVDVQSEGVSLEDAFLHFTGHDEEKRAAK
jgi:ABC-2 type transport system ATP-binding protein